MATLQVPGAARCSRVLERIETWRMWGLVRSQAGEKLDIRPLYACSVIPRIRCCSISRKAPAWRRKTQWCLRRKSRPGPTTPARAFKAYEQERYLRTGRTQIMARVYGEIYHARRVAAELRAQALGARTAEENYEGIGWLYGGP